MKAWISYLLWAVFPILLLFFFFGLLAVINWDYVDKLVTPRIDTLDWISAYLGPIMFASAIGLALIAGVLFFFVRVIVAKEGFGWAIWLPITLITIFFILPGVFIVILAPAAVTMIEQMNAGRK